MSEKLNALEEAKKRMKDLREYKAGQLEEIRQKQADLRAQIEAAAQDMKQATEDINVDGYEEAQNRKRKAEVALSMYTERFEQLKAKEYVSEKESDKVIDSLLAYENQIEADFKAAAAVHLRKLDNLLKDYRNEVLDIENTMKAWQRDIHANYTTRGMGSYRDKTTGEYTDRSPRPVPVHNMEYYGCAESERLRTYLTREAWIH